MGDLGTTTPKIVPTDGTYVHANLTTEQDAIEILTNNNKSTIIMDVSLLTQTTTIRVFEKTDGTTYKKSNEAIFPTEFDTGAENIKFTLNGKGRDQKITFQSGTLEGAARNIPFARVDEVRST